MSSRWTEYLETNYNFSPASSRIHLYNCIIEWTLCSIMKVCHIVVQTKSNHSFSYTEINFLWTKSLTPYKSDCNNFSSKNVVYERDPSTWWLIDWARAGKPVSASHSRFCTESRSKSISKIGVIINNFWGQWLHSENLQHV